VQSDFTEDELSRLQVDLCGLRLNSPTVLLSGCVGFGEEYTRIEGFDPTRVGAVCLKGTTLEPRLGNPPHRVCETPAGMLNAIGLQNPGAEYVVKTILPQLDFSETRFIANVSGSTVEEYEAVTRWFDDSPIDAIEINISCPNVKEGGVAFGNDPDMSARVVEACRRATDKPLITKLSPNQTDIQENARRCIEAGTERLRGHQHPHGHGHRHRGPQSDPGQRPGRALRTGHQAHRPAQGAPGVPGVPPPRHPHHRSGGTPSWWTRSTAASSTTWTATGSPRWPSSPAACACPKRIGAAAEVTRWRRRAAPPSPVP